MPDISMCSCHTCPSNNSCYRYKATPSYHQTYADFKPTIGEDRCNHYWEDNYIPKKEFTK